MTHKSYILTLCEGTKIDSATLQALTNTAWNEVRRKVEEYKVSGYAPEVIQEMLIKVAAYHDAAYHAVTQELVARGITIRREKSEELQIRDKADKEARREASQARSMGQDQRSIKDASKLLNGRNAATASRESKNSKVAKPTDGYTTKERKVLALVCSLIPPTAHPSSMADILVNLCKADSLVYSDLIKKFDLYGRPA